jgi:hypothetical protein
VVRQCSRIDRDPVPHQAAQLVSEVVGLDAVPVDLQDAFDARHDRRSFLQALIHSVDERAKTSRAVGSVAQRLPHGFVVESGIGGCWIEGS